MQTLQMADVPLGKNLYITDKFLLVLKSQSPFSSFSYELNIPQQCNYMTSYDILKSKHSAMESYHNFLQ